LPRIAHHRLFRDIEDAGGGLTRMIRRREARVDFDADARLTTARIELTVVPEPPVELDAFWAHLRRWADPRQWKHVASESFSISDVRGPVRRRPGGWSGILHERFEWRWDAGAVAIIDNDLDVDFVAGDDVISCRYELYKCNFSQLWVVREPGGLDCDGGSYRATRRRGRVAIEATKSIRFTTPEHGPEGFGGAINHLVPTMVGLWMDSGLVAIVRRALRDAAGGAAERARHVGSRDG
jgi:hypothetical protein